VIIVFAIKSVSCTVVMQATPWYIIPNETYSLSASKCMKSMK